MNILKKWINHGNITKTIVILFTFLVFIPIALVMLYYYNLNIRMIEREVTEAALRNIEQAELNISYRLKGIQEISNNIFMDKLINGYLSISSENATMSEQLEEMSHITNIFQNYQNNEDVFRIRLYIKKNKIYSKEHINFFEYNELDIDAWFVEIEKRSGSVFWRSTYFQSYIDIPPEYVISCSRQITSLENTGEVLGALFIDVRESQIYNVISDIKPFGKGNIFIVDNDNLIISHENKAVIGKAYDYAAEDGISKIDKSFIISHAIPSTGWKIVSVLSTDDILYGRGVSASFINVLIIVLVFLIFMAAFMVMFGYLVLRVNRRMNNMIVKIKKEGIGILNSEFVNSKETVYNLEYSVDAAIHNIKELMERTYQVEAEKKESELKILQAQINPHFLYNTLDNISWMAIKTGATDVSRMIQLLSKYFRLSLNRGRDIVSIDDELNLARIYLDMQNSRFMGRISVSFSIDEKVRQYCIPKLTLQPIIENAVMHGLQRKENTCWKISISANIIGEEIKFEISDNGAGMSKEVLALLLGEPKEKKTFSYGLYNVNKRLQLLFGEEYGVSAESVLDQGSTITIRIKAINIE